MDDNDALRAIIKEALEGKGVLSQIRASLRAAVFTCVDEHERVAGVHVHNPSALRVKHDPAGHLALQVVVDFLAHFELNKTLSVLKMETNMDDDDLLPRRELASILGSTGRGGDGITYDEELPAIMQLLPQNCAPIWNGDAQEADHVELNPSGETGPSGVTLSERTDTKRLDGAMFGWEDEVRFHRDGQDDESACDFTDRGSASAVHSDREDAMPPRKVTTTRDQEGGKPEQQMQTYEATGDFVDGVTATDLAPDGPDDETLTGKKTTPRGEEGEGFHGMGQMDERAYYFTARASAAVINTNRRASPPKEEMAYGHDVGENVFCRAKQTDGYFAQGAEDTNVMHSDRQDKERRLGMTMGGGLEGEYFRDDQTDGSAYDITERADAFRVHSNRPHATGTAGLKAAGHQEASFYRRMQMDERAYDFMERASPTAARPDWPDATSEEGEEERRSHRDGQMDESASDLSERASALAGMTARVGDDRKYHRGTYIDESAYDFTERAAAPGVQSNLQDVTTGRHEEGKFRRGMRMDESAYDFMETASAFAAHSNRRQDSRRVAMTTAGEHENKFYRDKQTDDERMFDFTELARIVDPGAGSSEVVVSGIAPSNSMMSSGHETVVEPSAATTSMSRVQRSRPPPTHEASWTPIGPRGVRLDDVDVGFGYGDGILSRSNETREGDDGGNEGRALETTRPYSAPLAADRAPGDGSRVNSSREDFEASSEIQGSDGGYVEQDWDGSENYEDDDFEGDEAAAAAENGQQEAQPGSDGDGPAMHEGDETILEGDNSADEVLFDVSLSEGPGLERARKADEEWEMMIGVSADSSFSGGPGILEEQGYEFEDAKSV
ncbi:unnamed protein product [Ascophyllum nodosum]